MFEQKIFELMIKIKEEALNQEVSNEGITKRNALLYCATLIESLYYEKQEEKIKNWLNENN